MVTCEICNEAPGRLICPTCGRRVCPLHFTGDRCTICREATCRICRSNLALTHCMICGRLACSDCLVQVDNVRRVCRDCLPLARARRWPGPGEVRLYSLGARRLTYRILHLYKARGNIPRPEPGGRQGGGSVG